MHQSLTHSITPPGSGAPEEEGSVMKSISVSPFLLSSLDRLLGSVSVWQLRGLSPDTASRFLENQPAGTFLAHTAADRVTMISVRLPDEGGAPAVRGVAVQQHHTCTVVHLEGSSLLFDDVFKLISFYCTSSSHPTCQPAAGLLFPSHCPGAQQQILSDVDSFLLLLSNILQRSGVISSKTICQPTGELGQNRVRTRSKLGRVSDVTGSPFAPALTQFCFPSGSRELVAAGLWQSGYHGDWTSGGPSSDPLLALGWLLAQGILEKLLAARAAELDRMLLDTGPATTGTKTLEATGPDSVSLRTLQWLMGRLRHQGRTLLSTAGGQTRALHDVLSTSQVCSPAPPAGQSSAALTEDSVCVQQLCDILEAYLSWRRVEDIFWTWMDSVADRRHTGPHAATSFQGLGMCHHGNQGLAQLEQLLMRLPITQETESLWGQRSEDDPACRSPVLSVPSVCQVWRPRLQAGSRGPPAAPPALARLLQAERLLLRHRAARRLANRKRLRLLMRGLRRQVFVPL
ncbi:hypothetical protein CCH79_00004345 [Gambusia affinis]|uniref:Tubulin epsilon and delta complex protein 1 domain-containing protein n=1 Tax=Gambusia affinis TaxID=33528 RepID=A0A315UYP3_GAMAF|nr:hypothetical protein CCH79_00004345 [Gambusia affinis]